MSDLPVIRDAEDLPLAWARVEAQPTATRLLIKDRFESLRDFQSVEEQFGSNPTPTKELPEILPHDSVFLLNWMLLRPRAEVPAPAVRTAELRERVATEIQAQFGPPEGET